ncbi:methionine adenosyltransferase [Candidatus Dependentiae bacterium]|nr:methionine adenosyltransferase [Candidatus Dependentiae bacterium]
MSRQYLFTSESVSEGHPDKVADQISDGILDAIFTQDPNSRVACETLITTGLIAIAGEITTKATVDYQNVARTVVKNIGYTGKEYGFDCDASGVIVALDKQSPDISQGVTEGQGLHKEQGAGDQGMMFGYANSDTPELMPAPIMYAHKLLIKLAELRKSKKLAYVGPDSKSQVTCLYDGRKLVKIDTVVISTQHLPSVSLSKLKKEIEEKVIRQVLPKKLIDNKLKVHVNPTGRFVVGGPNGDCGLTGRKIIVDTYGGKGRHGGGAFSGKDPSKVDRSAAYMGRYIAKNIVAAGLAEECEVQLAYAIGIAKPVSVYVNTFGTGKIEESIIEKAVLGIFDTTPKGIITTLDLRKPIYLKTAAYGHFGRNIFSWEKTNKVDELKKLLKK